MTFLNPAVLFGLIATAIPVLLHLLNLRKLKRIEFSTLTFLKELQKNKIRRIKLKQWLLLALRFLIILFVVFSFARPTLQGVSIGGATSSAKTTAVFILDNTFSMSVVNEKGSNFNRARQVIKTLLNELQEGDEAALVTVAGAGREEVKTTTNLAEFRKKLDAADLSFESGTINKALITAGELLSGSHNFNKEIYLLSDFQKTNLSEPDQAVSNLSGILNDKVKLYMFDFSGKDVYNLGIDALEANNQIFEKGKPVSFTAAVTNYSPRSAVNTVASLFINGERSAQQSISLDAGETKNVVFETVLKSSGYADITAGLEDDDVLQDNRRYLNIVVPDKINLVIFSDRDADAGYVELALASSGENGTINITKRNFSQISSVNLNSYDAVIAIGSESAGSAGKLKDYVLNGGSLFLMPGSASNLANFRSLLAELQLPEPTSMAGNPNSSANAAVFDKIDFEHPVFSGLFAKGAKKQVESPDVYYYFRLNTQGRGKNIITLPDNSSFLGEYSLGKGKVLLMNTAPVMSWSSFPMKGLFAPVMSKAVFYLASRDHSTGSYTAGEAVTINLQNRTLPQIKISRPDKNDEVINLGSSLRQNYITYNNTNTAGNYRVYSGDKLVDYFSVNASPLESNTRSLTLKEFGGYLSKTGFKGKQFRLDVNENYTRQIQQARFGSELWRHFLLLALVLALVEMLISRSAKKDTF